MSYAALFLPPGNFCAALPLYKRPCKIISTEVPQNPTGKIEKPKLSDQYACGSVVKAQIENLKFD